MTDGDATTAGLRVTHHHTHCNYVSIGLSTEEKALVHDMKGLAPSKVCVSNINNNQIGLLIMGLQIWDEILKRNPQTNLTQKQIHAEWTKVNETAWKFDDDQVKSTSELLAQTQGLDDCEIIPIQHKKGINAIAFGFNGMLDDIGDNVKEIAMDSTCTYLKRLHLECS
jgi:hypothetical protein